MAPEGYEIDHRDRNRLNNEKGNLRFATHSQNCANKDIKIDSTLGIRGVHWLKKYGKYEAYINKDRVKINLGYFDNKDVAARVYNENAIKLFGEFAVINEVEG